MKKAISSLLACEHICTYTYVYKIHFYGLQHIQVYLHVFIHVPSCIYLIYKLYKILNLQWITCLVLLHHPASWMSTSRSWVLAMRYGGPLMRPGSRASSKRRRGSWPMWDMTRLPAFSSTSSANATNAASSASGEPATWEGLMFLQKAGTFLVPGSWCDRTDTLHLTLMYIPTYYTSDHWLSDHCKYDIYYIINIQSFCMQS